DIHQVQKELLASEVELANLINAPINKSLTLEPPVMVEKSPKVLSLPIEDLEKVALYNNAELKEQSYDVEIAALETRSALLDLLPDLTLSVGRQYTSDSYVINNEWHQGALSISYNLLSLLNVQGVKKQAAAREDLAKMRRVAMQMTVVAQVHLAAMQAKNTLANLQNAAELHEVERKIEVLKTNQRTAGKISQTELVRAQTSSLVAELRRYQALAGFHSAMGRLQASLGLEPNISSIQSSSLPQIESEVQKSITGWYSGDIVRREISLISQIE
ncbi:MAG TPA: TolC family protein, partial [Alphaproteobacteria bacterium]|nr:TolC family protein [Alphaproteobacteria bacterium]